MINETTHNSELGIELSLLDAWRRRDFEALAVLAGSVADDETPEDNHYSMQTVVR